MQNSSLRVPFWMARGSGCSGQLQEWCTKLVAMSSPSSLSLLIQLDGCLHGYLVPPSVAHRGGSSGSEGLVSPETHPGFCGPTLVPFSQGASFRNSSPSRCFGKWLVSFLSEFLYSSASYQCPVSNGLLQGWVTSSRGRRRLRRGVSPWVCWCRWSCSRLPCFGWCLPCRSPGAFCLVCRFWLVTSKPMMSQKALSDSRSPVVRASCAISSWVSSRPRCLGPLAERPDPVGVGVAETGGTEGAPFRFLVTVLVL